MNRLSTRGQQLDPATPSLRHPRAVLRALTCPVYLAIALCATLILGRPAVAGTAVAFTPEPVNGAVFNQGMGVYLQFPPLDLPPDHWTLSVADIAYYRLDWAPLNPESGAYRFEEIFGPYFDRWVKKQGKRVAFRVMSQNYCSSLEYVSPRWIFEQAGVPGVESKELLVSTKRQVMPVPWSERYLEVYCAFVAKLGEYLDGRPGLEFVDIGAIGEWGEMHFLRWDEGRRAANGYSDFLYIQAQRRVIDAYRRAFPRTRIFLNVGYPKFHTIHEYAAARGLHFRQDGLMPNGAMGNCEEWLFKPFARRGTQCNLEFWGYYPQMVAKGYSLPATIDKALSAPISYLNANLGTFGKETPPIVVAELTRAAERVGYRLRPLAVRTPATFKVRPSRSTPFPIQGEWVNGGTVAPPLNLALRWSLHDAAGNERAHLESFPPQATTLWFPSETNRSSDLLLIPKGLAPGPYTLRAAFFLPENGARIRLDVKRADAERRHTVAELTAVEDRSTAAYPLALRRETFESNMEGWYGACVGLKPERAAGMGVEGSWGLKISGRKTKGWSYAMLDIEPKARPNAHYRLSGMMRIASLTSGRPQSTSRDLLPPFIKLDVRDLGGKHLENVNSSRYDLSRLGEWQAISLTVVTTDQVGSLAFGWETGDFNAPMDIEGYLDDVLLEILDEP